LGQLTSGFALNSREENLLSMEAARITAHGDRSVTYPAMELSCCGFTLFAMSIKPEETPAVIVVARKAERKGLCVVCKNRCNMDKTFRAKAGPLDRKPDGSMYTEAELEAAVDDQCARWKKGPPCHHLCAVGVTDKLAGFDIATGKYGLPPADLSVFYGGALTEPEDEENYDFSLGELQVTGAFTEGAH